MTRIYICTEQLAGSSFDGIPVTVVARRTGVGKAYTEIKHLLTGETHLVHPHYVVPARPGMQRIMERVLGLVKRLEQLNEATDRLNNYLRGAE